jgi:hypothetical protein
VDEATRNDIAAATAAHHELGRDYEYRNMSAQVRVTSTYDRQ